MNAPASPAVVRMDDRELDFHRAAVHAGLIVCEYRFVQRQRCVVSWNAERDAFTVESLGQLDGAVLDSEIREEEDLTTALIARQKTDRGWIAQYLVTSRPEPKPAPFSYRPPIDRVCPDCGAKHTEYGMRCAGCRDAMNRERG